MGELLDIAKSLSRLADDMRALAAQLSALEDARAPAPPPDGPPWVDYIDQMPTNPQARNPRASPGRWATRTDDQIRGITIHHTLSHDPVAVAHYITREKSLPTTEYTLWVTKDGQALLCTPLNLALWHDHCGYPNYHISIGMAGSLHVTAPPPRQIEGTVKAVAYLMHQYDIPLSEVQGHNDRYDGTVCPGWDSANWRGRFFDALREELHA